jgi:hypothetical protein
MTGAAPQADSRDDRKYGHQLLFMRAGAERSLFVSCSRARGAVSYLRCEAAHATPSFQPNCVGVKKVTKG